MISINWRPSERELRQFAGIWFPAFWVVVGLLLGFRGGLWTIAVPMWVVAGMVAVAGLIQPRLMRPVFVGWMCAAYPIGWVVSHVLLAAVFYLAITPLGLVARLLGRDKLNLSIDRQAETYWARRPAAPPPERYFRQF